MQIVLFFKIQTSNYALQMNRPDTIWRCQVATSRAGSPSEGGVYSQGMVRRYKLSLITCWSLWSREPFWNCRLR